MAREKLPAGKKRDVMIYFRVRPREARELEKLARNADLSRSSIIRQLVNESLARRAKKVLAANA